MTPAPTAAIVLVGPADAMPEKAWWTELEAVLTGALRVASSSQVDGSAPVLHPPVQHIVGDRRVVELHCAGPSLQWVQATTAPVLDLVDPRVSAGVVPARLGAHHRLLVVFDVDSTFIQDEVIELLAAHAGRQSEVAAVTQAAMRGEVDFAESLRRRVSVLAGLSAQVFAQVAASIRVTPGAGELVRALQAAGHAVALVSGGFVEIVQPLAEQYDIAYVRANALDIDDGRLTGRVRGEVVDRAVKARTLLELAALEGIEPDCTVAIGDGANDLDMVTAAGLGIAVNAKPALRAGADLVLQTTRLDVLVPILGIGAD